MDVLTEASIRSALSRFVQLVNARKLKEACELFADDVYYEGRFGCIRGRKAITQLYIEQASNLGKGRISFELVELRQYPAQGDTVVATAIVESVLEEGGTRNKFRTFLALVAENGKVRIAQEIGLSPQTKN